MTPRVIFTSFSLWVHEKLPTDYRPSAVLVLHPALPKHAQGSVV
jgi:hypothetical protein